MTLRKLNLAESFAGIDESWVPHIAGEVNGTQIKLAKLKGEFVWHSHELEDEAFLVISGTLSMELRDGTIELEPGELLVIPRGTEHRPVCAGECHVLLVEPASTLNTGVVSNEHTVREPPRIMD